MNIQIHSKHSFKTFKRYTKQHRRSPGRASTRGEDSRLAAFCTAVGVIAIAARGADAGGWLENLARSRARLPCASRRVHVAYTLRIIIIQISSLNIKY